MNEEKLKDKLNSVGRNVFVECFSLFKSCNNDSMLKKDCIEKLMQKYPDKQESGCLICFGNAKLIFEANMECKAIGLICKEWRKTKLPKDTIDKAMGLLQDCP